MRRTVIIVGTVLVVLAGAYSAYWYVTAGILADIVATWIEQRRDDGFEVTTSEPEVYGFPIAFRMDLEDPAITAPPRGGAWQWRGPTIRAQAELWDPWDIRFSVPGAHEVTASTAAGPQTFIGQATSADGYFDLYKSGGFERAGLDVAGLELLAEGGMSLAAERVQAAVDASGAQTDRPEESEVSVTARIRDAVLPDELRLPLGPAVRLAELEAVLVGTVPPEPPQLALEAWRQAGGTLEVRRLATEWGGFGLTGDGTFALDEALQPVGAMTATITGLDAAISALVEAGLISRAQGTIATLATAALSQPAGEGAERSIKVPLTIQDGSLSLGPVKLMAVPRIRWAGPES